MNGTDRSRSADVAVVGAGSFGTALADVLARGGNRVTQWVRDPAQAAEMARTRENARYLPGLPIDPGVRFTSSLEEAVGGREVVLAVVPSHGMGAVMGEAACHVHPEAVIVSGAKGIEVDTLRTMDEVLRDVLPPSLGRRLAFLSGPSFAREVMERHPTVVTVASHDPGVAARAQEVFSSPEFRVYTHDDVAGVEIAGAVKNVMAIGCGISDGLGYGFNTRAAIITRGLAEITRLGVARGASPLTFAGLAGVGDLVLTCTGDLSRNRQVGLQLGRGRRLAEVLGEMRQVAEGVRTTRSVRDLSRRLGVDMPIVEQVHAVLYEDKDANQAVRDLMARTPRREVDPAPRRG